VTVTIMVMMSMCQWQWRLRLQWHCGSDSDDYIDDVSVTVMVTMTVTLWQGNENYTGIAARDTANALRVLTNAVRGVAATSNDRELQDSIVDHAWDVMDKSANLIEEAKKAVANPQNPDNQTRLAQVFDVNG